ncbi:acetyl-CoA synthetase, partial [mine drainage metagenome]
MRLGKQWPQKYNLSSLKLLGSVGEPINPEAWLWFRDVTGGRLPIMDTWWQTETGMHMITPLPGVPLVPGSATRPFPGVIADVVNRQGESVGPGEAGFVIIRKPWPSMFRTVYKDPERY